MSPARHPSEAVSDCGGGRIPESAIREAVSTVFLETAGIAADPSVPMTDDLEANQIGGEVRKLLCADFDTGRAHGTLLKSIHGSRVKAVREQIDSRGVHGLLPSAGGGAPREARIPMAATDTRVIRRLR